MPEYIYENPETGEQVTVLQSVHEEHIYEIDGVVYDRVYTLPNTSIDTKIDPDSASDFREKAKGIVLQQVMEGDKTLVSDVKRYLTEMADYKKPLPKEEQTAYVLGSEFKPNKNAETKKLSGVQGLIEQMKQGNTGTNITSRHIPNIYIKQTEGGYAFYKRNFDSNKEDEQLTEFFNNNPTDIANVMKMIGPVIGLNTTKELQELDNFLLYYKYL